MVVLCKTTFKAEKFSFYVNAVTYSVHVMQYDTCRWQSHLCEPCSKSSDCCIPHAAAADAGEKLGSCPCEPSYACMPSLPEHRTALCQKHAMGFATATILLG